MHTLYKQASDTPTAGFRFFLLFPFFFFFNNVYFSPLISEKWLLDVRKMSASSAKWNKQNFWNPIQIFVAKVVPFFLSKFNIVCVQVEHKVNVNVILYGETTLHSQYLTIRRNLSLVFSATTETCTALYLREMTGTLPASAGLVHVCISALISKCALCKREHFMNLWNFSLHVTQLALLHTPCSCTLGITNIFCSVSQN